MKKISIFISKLNFHALGSMLKYEVDESKLTMPIEALELYVRMIEEEVNQEDVVLYMKGSRYFPECGYSESLVNILEKYPIKYVTKDVNNDLNYKEALKVFSDWPTIPQLFIEGVFVGGMQIVTELDSEGKLEELLPIEDDL